MIQVRLILKVVVSIAVAWAPNRVDAQDLAPRAYFISPLHSNAITLTESFFNGDIDYNGVIPISNATGIYNIPTLSYYHSFGLFGRSVNLVASLPYGVGNFQGTAGNEMRVYRSGLLDSIYRVSVNLVGGPAMPIEKFVKWKQKKLLGVSLKVIAPTGQYDPTKLINWGTNRWSFKPELGYSQAWGKWILDAYSGVWLFTENPEFWSRNFTYPGTRTNTTIDCSLRRTHQLRLQTATVALARRQLLVRWDNESGGCRKLTYTTG